MALFSYIPFPPDYDASLLQSEDYPLLWEGKLHYRQATINIQMTKILGNSDLAKAALPADGQQINITETLLVDSCAVQHILYDRLKSHTTFCLLLGLACGETREIALRDCETLRQRFVDYLYEKESVGILRTGTCEANKYGIYVFPQCPFIEDLLLNEKPVAHDIIQDLPCVVTIIIRC